MGKRPPVDPSHKDHLETTAVEELDLGVVKGPFLSESEVTAHLGRNDWCVVSRFVLVQGSELTLS